MKPVKIAQIGTGHDHAPMTFNSLRKQSDCFEVLGVAEPNPEHTHRLTDQEQYQGAHVYSVEELLQLPELEAVTIETDEELATGFAQQFADRGVAVHLDKPGTADIAAFTRLARTLQASQLPLHMGYMYRYNPLIQRAFAQIKNGALGEIYAVEAHMSVHHTPEKRAWLGKYPGGMMYFLGCHLVDLVLQLQGLPGEVIAMNASTGADGVTAMDYGFAALRYPHGTSFVKSCANEYNGFDRRQLVICGTKGTIELKPLESYIPETDGKMHTLATYTDSAHEKAIWADATSRWDCEPFDRYDAMMRSFAQIIRGEIKNPYSYDYEIQLFRTIMKCCGVLC